MFKLSELSQWFWDDEFWLPPNVTWKDVQTETSYTGVSYADFSHLGYPLVIGWLLVVLRLAIEHLVFRPLGRKIGIRHHKPNRSKLASNHELEMEFRRSKQWSQDTIAKFSRKRGVTERDVEVWLRYQRALSHPSKLDKFAETGWRWVFYTGVFVFGLYVLCDKTWFWNILDCWLNFPHHDMLDDVWWYYMVELSFYWCLFFSQFMGDVQRKDFWTMFVHHLATILLISFSWACHLHKIGTLIMITCDVSDVFLELAKLFHYAEQESMSTVLFALFTLVWVCTRMGVYPTWIIYSITVEAPQMVQYYPAYSFFNVLLSSLLVLNIIWTYSILKVSYITILSPNKRIEGDIRSQTSEDITDLESESKESEKKTK